MIRILLGGGKLSLAPLVQAAADDYDNAPGLAKLALRISFVFESWGCHPDYSGHMQKFEAMRKIYEEPYSARDTYLKGLWDFIESFIYTLKHDLNVTAFIKEKLFGTILGIVTYDFRG